MHKPCEQRGRGQAGENARKRSLHESASLLPLPGAIRQGYDEAEGPNVT
jgi:hypothetical protein